MFVFDFIRVSRRCRCESESSQHKVSSQHIFSIIVARNCHFRTYAHSIYGLAAVIDCDASSAQLKSEIFSPTRATTLARTTVRKSQSADNNWKFFHQQGLHGGRARMFFPVNLTTVRSSRIRKTQHDFFSICPTLPPHLLLLLHSAPFADLHWARCSRMCRNEVETTRQRSWNFFTLCLLRSLCRSVWIYIFSHKHDHHTPKGGKKNERWNTRLWNVNENSKLLVGFSSFERQPKKSWNFFDMKHWVRKTEDFAYCLELKNS